MLTAPHGGPPGLKEISIGIEFLDSIMVIGNITSIFNHVHRPVMTDSHAVRTAQVTVTSPTASCSAQFANEMSILINLDDPLFFRICNIEGTVRT
jgi:hypothetical protein